RSRSVHTALLVADQHVRQGGGVRVAVEGLPLRREKRLADACDVAVPEDAEAADNEPLLDAVTLAVLSGQEPYQRLRDGEPDGCRHRRPLSGCWYEDVTHDLVELLVRSEE